MKRTGGPKSESQTPAIPAEQDDFPLLSEVVDEMGYGLAQVRAILVGGGVWLADGSELLLISCVTDAVADEWSLDPMKRGAVVTIVFVGILLGNMISGPLGDNFGRRKLIIASYVGIFVFSILSSFVQDYYSLAVARLFVGLAFGMGQPAWNTLGSELTPSPWRLLTMGITMSLFSAGELWSCLLLIHDDPSMENLHWRWLLRMGAIPSLVFLVLSFFLLHESPSFLATTGEYDRAKEVLDSLRVDNGAGDVKLDFHIPPTNKMTFQEKIDRLINVVFGRRLLQTTLIVWYMCFVLNFLFYGALYAFPQVLSDVSTEGSASYALIMGTLTEAPGILIGTMMGLTLPRKTATKAALGVCVPSLLLVAFCVSSAGTNKYAMFFFQLGYLGIKMFGTGAFVVVYQYSVEVYPTEARTTGTAVNIAGGRLAGMASPLIFELSAQATGGFGFFFYFTAALAALNIVLVNFLPETAGQKLKDHLSESSSDEKEELLSSARQALASSASGSKVPYGKATA